MEKKKACRTKAEEEEEDEEEEEEESDDSDDDGGEDDDLVRGNATEGDDAEDGDAGLHRGHRPQVLARSRHAAEQRLHLPARKSRDQHRQQEKQPLAYHPVWYVLPDYEVDLLLFDIVFAILPDSTSPSYTWLPVSYNLQKEHHNNTH